MVHLLTLSLIGNRFRYIFKCEFKGILFSCNSFLSKYIDMDKLKKNNSLEIIIYYPFSVNSHTDTHTHTRHSLERFSLRC